MYMYAMYLFRDGNTESKPILSYRMTNGVARVWQRSVALATPIFTGLLDKLNFLSSLNNAKHQFLNLGCIYKIKHHPLLSIHSLSHTNIHGLVRP